MKSASTLLFCLLLGSTLVAKGDVLWLGDRANDNAISIPLPK